MSTPRAWFAAVVYACAALAPAVAETFATFPELKELVSPDKRYVLRSVDPPHGPAEFSGMFHVLVLEDRVTGKSRRLTDYLHKIAVAWSADRIIATDYVSRKSSRALVLSVDPNADVLVVDRNDLAGRIPLQLRDCLRENDHVFVEAVRMERRTLVLRVWGYGAHDPKGFQLACELNVADGTASCRENRHAPSLP